MLENWETLRPHYKQSRLWRTRARFVAVAAGRGSGKTELARRRIVRFLNVKKPWPDPCYFYALPTYGQAKRVAWDKIKALVPTDMIAPGGVSESGMTITTVYGSKLYVVGLDKPARVEGIQWDGCVIDESSDQKPGHFERSIRPALSHRRGWCWRIGVPKRFGPGAPDFKRYYDFCMSPESGDSHEAFAWPSWDILPADEIEAARRSMADRDFREQYGASWESIAGLIFYAYDDELNVDRDVTYSSSKPIIVGSDFNVDPMAWVLMQQADNGSLYVFDEVWIRNTSTAQTLDYLHSRFPHHNAGWLFFGDASGRARNTRAAHSDYAQIRNDIRFTQKRVFYPRSNPSLVDRFASCNAEFCNAARERKLFVHPRCVQLRTDLKVRAYEEGTRQPADSGDIGHITDALGYVIHCLRPIGHTIGQAQALDRVSIGT